MTSRILPLSIAVAVAVAVVLVGCTSAPPEATSRPSAADHTARPSAATADAIAAGDCARFVPLSDIGAALGATVAPAAPDPERLDLSPAVAAGGIACSWDAGDSREGVTATLVVLPTARADSGVVTSAVASSGSCLSGADPQCTVAGEADGWWFQLRYRAAPSAASGAAAALSRVVDAGLASTTPHPVARTAPGCAAVAAAMRPGSAADVAEPSVDEATDEMTDYLAILGEAVRLSGVVSCGVDAPLSFSFTLLPGSAASFSACAAAGTPVELPGVMRAVTAPGPAGVRLCATDGTSSLDMGLPSLGGGSAATPQTWDAAHLAWAARTVPPVLERFRG